MRAPNYWQPLLATIQHCIVLKSAPSAGREFRNQHVSTRVGTTRFSRGSTRVDPARRSSVFGATRQNFLGLAVGIASCLPWRSADLALTSDTMLRYTRAAPGNTVGVVRAWLAGVTTQDEEGGPFADAPKLK